MVVDEDVDIDDLFTDLENMVCQKIQVYLSHSMELGVFDEGQILRNFLYILDKKARNVEFVVHFQANMIDDFSNSKCLIICPFSCFVFRFILWNFFFWIPKEVPIKSIRNDHDIVLRRGYLSSSCRNTSSTLLAL